MSHEHLTFDWSTAEPGISDVDEYRRTKRLIRFQDRRAEHGNLSRKAVDGYGYEFRYLVVKSGRAVFQCDDAMDAIAYAVEHRPNCNIIDLRSVDERSRRKLIGQYLAPREASRQVSPVLDKSTGKFTFGVHESLEKKRYLPGEVIPLRSLKDRPYQRNTGKATVINTTPAKVIVERFLNGQPLTPNYICDKCGYGKCMCEAKRREKSALPLRVAGERKAKTNFGLSKPSADIFSASAILNDRLMGRIPRAELWVCE
jgi:hypothetical protein